MQLLHRLLNLVENHTLKLLQKPFKIIFTNTKINYKELLL